jgi:hypothetical protein
MATSVTQSLFGMTPQAIQAQRAAELQQQALRFAQLTPMQQAQMGLFQAGSQLGTGLAGLMGYEDPEIAQAKARQGLLSGLDASDPQALRAAARNSDPETANLLITRALGLEKGMADISASEALAKQRSREADPVTEFAKTGKYTPQSLAKFAQSRNVADLQLVENLSLPEIARLQSYRETLTDPKKIAEVDAVIKAAAEGRGTKVNVSVSPTLKQAGAITGLVKDYDDLTKIERETLQTVTQAKSLINEASTANNSVAWESARTQIAKAVGEGRLSNEDIRRTGVDPRLVQGALDWVNKKIEGVPNQDIQRQLFTVASILERSAVNKINATAQRTRAVAGLEGIPEEQQGILFPTIPQNNSPRRQPSSGAVNWSDLP